MGYKEPAILGLSVVTPDFKHGQMELHDRWLTPFIHSHRARAIFSAAEIDTRYSVLPDSSFFASEPGGEERNALYMKAARPLATKAIRQALGNAGLTPSDIDHFIVVSCTGFDNPGLDVILAGDLGMRTDLRRTALIGMGCYAGLTGVDRAISELAARPKSHVLVLALEFGTLHFQHGKKLENMIAAALFGDGLAALVIGTASDGDGKPRLLDTMTYCDYKGQDLMGFHPSDKGYQIHLSTRVPKLLREIVPGLITKFLNRSNLAKSDINFWGIHPGGAKILDYIEQALELEPEELNCSRYVLRRYGNMSSVTIFFVLDAIIQQKQPQSGDYALLLSFGPGLTIELCLVRW